MGRGELERVVEPERLSAEKEEGDGDGDGEGGGKLEGSLVIAQRPAPPLPSNIDTLLYTEKDGSCSRSSAEKARAFCPNTVTDLMLRSASLTLSAANFLSFLISYGNKITTVSILILLTVGLHFVGSLNTVLPLSRTVLPTNNPLLTIIGGTVPMLLSSELFVWILYVRFTAVAPLRQNYLQITAKTWLILETLFIFSIAVVWGWGAIGGDFTYRSIAANLYIYGSALQAFTSFALSAYFIARFYVPIFKGLHKRGKSLVVALATTGLFYLVVETVLHLGFIAFFRIDATKPFSTGLNHVCTSARHSILLVFIYKIRSVSSLASGRKLFNQSSSGGGEGPTISTSGIDSKTRISFANNPTVIQEQPQPPAPPLPYSTPARTFHSNSTSPLPPSSPTQQMQSPNAPPFPMPPRKKSLAYAQGTLDRYTPTPVPPTSPQNPPSNEPKQQALEYHQRYYPTYNATEEPPLPMSPVLREAPRVYTTPQPAMAVRVQHGGGQESG
ncbi:hypothetical protein HDV05_004762 [Chytridiales sp. JEL 0842]|nr:hypothetical protein HDV05_004762 [Chytridiales sp. JEL 0842]